MVHTCDVREMFEGIILGLIKELYDSRKIPVGIVLRHPNGKIYRLNLKNPKHVHRIGKI